MFVLFQVYCGFIQDSYITLSNGVITSFSSNRNDPRFIVKDTATNITIVCAINYNSVWIVGNITGLGYLKVA